MLRSKSDDTFLASLLKRGKINFAANPGYFIPWTKHLKRQFDDAGVSAVMEPNSKSVVMSSEAVDSVIVYNRIEKEWDDFFSARGSSAIGLTRPRYAIPPRPSQSAVDSYNRYNRDVDRYTEKYDRAKAIVIDNLSENQESIVEYIVHDPALNGRQKSFRIIEHFRSIYGTPIKTNTGPIKDIMTAIPIATDETSAEHLIAALTFWNGCLREINPKERDNDEDMVARLFKKLHGQQFDLISQQIDQNPNITFHEAVLLVHQTINLHRQKNVKVVNVLTTSRPIATLTRRDTSSSTSSSVAPYMVQATTVSALPPGQIPCWNCVNNSQVLPHTRDQCKALYCNNCHTSWRSSKAPGYHSFTKCETRLRQIQQSSNKKSDEGGVLARHSSMGTKRAASSSFSNPPPKRSAFTVQTLQESQDESDEEYLQAHMVEDTSDSPEPEDIDEAFDYQIKVMNVNMSSTLSNPARVLVDSGANICCTPPTIVELIPALKVYTWNRPKAVVFGNGTRTLSKFYVYLGPIMGNTAIVHGLSSTILGVSPINDRGYNVTCTWRGTCVLTKGDDPSPLVDEPIDGTAKLYYIGLQHFVNLNDITKLPVHTATALQSSVPLSPVAVSSTVPTIPSLPPATVTGIRKRPHVSKSELCQAVTLHNNLYHAASPAAMAAALRAGAWPGISLDPRIVEQLYLHQDCIACLLGKMNRPPRSLGSGILPNPFEVISMDYKPSRYYKAF